MDNQPNTPQDMWPEDEPDKPQSSPPPSQPTTPPTPQQPTPQPIVPPAAPQPAAPSAPQPVSPPISQPAAPSALQPEQQKTSYNFARDGFIYILSYFTLMIFSVATNHLIKAVINPLLPRDASRSDWLSAAGNNGMIIGLLAAIIIAFPVYAGLNIWANRMLGSGQMRHNTGVRSWLIYLTMTVVAIVVISQLVWLMVTYLGGGSPVRVSIHALISILIALAVLGYQWWQLRFFDGSPKKITKGFRIFEWSVIAVVGIALIWGFASIESPATKQAHNNDSSRISALTTIAGRINNFYGSKGSVVGLGRLPQSFEELTLFGNNRNLKIDDPITGKRFEYKVTGAESYELCATFEARSSSSSSSAVWDHPKGHYCFDKTISR